MKSHVEVPSSNDEVVQPPLVDPESSKRRLSDTTGAEDQIQRDASSCKLSDLNRDENKNSSHTAKRDEWEAGQTSDFESPNRYHPPAKSEAGYFEGRQTSEVDVQDYLNLQNLQTTPSKLDTRPRLRPPEPLNSSTDRNELHSQFQSNSLQSSPSLRVTKLSQESSADILPGSSSLIHEMSRKVLSRDFWMKDENAKVCFNCGDAFTTFRRKHHCRTCGQIYDAKCTLLVPGKLFSTDGRLRICKTCENMIVGDDSSDYSGDDEPGLSLHGKSIRFSGFPQSSPNPSSIHTSPTGSRFRNSSTSRTPQNSRRKSLVIPSEMAPQTLARPSSSRSLRSINGRPRSSSQRFRTSRHQHMRSLRTIDGDALPLGRSSMHSRDGSSMITQPNDVIDPDLAPYISDGDASEPDHTLSGAQHHRAQEPQNAYDDGGIPYKSKKMRPTLSSKSLLDLGQTLQDAESASIFSSKNVRRRTQLGKRSLSSGSIIGRSGVGSRHGRSDNVFAAYQPSASFVIDGDADEHEFDLANQSRNLEKGFGSTKQESSLAELNQPSLFHVKKLLRQFLQDNEVEHIKSWQNALLPLLLQCAEEVDPNIQRGDDIDIRHYVKLKKASGGRPQDSCYVSGVVFSKNVALKGMRRCIDDARLLLISFPLVYARHQKHYMSLEPVIAQEREYLRNLVTRIVTLRPDVVLVQRNVSGLALQYLHEACITVAYNVKDSALQAISRCAKTRIVSSVDKLSLDSKYLGTCERFEVKTVLNDGLKKSLMFISGCQKDLGCTIVLRGADYDTLRKMKWITEFMCYAVYNLKLETSLIRDHFLSQSLSPAKDNIHPRQKTTGLDSLHLRSAEDDEIDSSWANSVSPADSNLQIKDRYGSLDANNTVDKTPVKQRSLSNEYQKVVDELRNRVLSISPAVTLDEPHLLLSCRDQEAAVNQLRSDIVRINNYDASDHAANSGSSSFELVTQEVVKDFKKCRSNQVKQHVERVRAAEYDRAAENLSSLKRRWETYIAGAADPFNPWSHQQIVVLFSIVSNPTTDACEGPDLMGLDFYQEHDAEAGLEPDVPLGEYIERICHQIESPCTAGRCDQLMLHHYRQYVHGDGQLKIHVGKHSSKLRGMRNTILMWSQCRICNQETPVTPMSVNSWKYSFAKYLELSFWGASLMPRAGVCPHNVLKDHIRFFGFKDLAVQLQYDPINVMEVIVPKSVISWKVAKDISTKNKEFLRIEERLNRFTSSIAGRIESIKLDNVEDEKVDDCKREITILQQKVADDHQFLLCKLRDKYESSAFYEIIPLNRAVRAMQEKVVGWDILFTEFENRFFPSEKDLGNLAAQQLKKMYLDRNDVAQVEDHSDSDNYDETEKNNRSKAVSKLPGEETNNLFPTDQKAAGPYGEDSPRSFDLNPEPHRQEQEVLGSMNERESAFRTGDDQIDSIIDRLDLAMSSTPIADSPSLESSTVFDAQNVRAFGPKKASSIVGEKPSVETTQDQSPDPSDNAPARFQISEPTNQRGLVRANTQPVYSQRLTHEDTRHTRSPEREAAATATPQSLIPLPVKSSAHGLGLASGKRDGSSHAANNEAQRHQEPSMIPRSVPTKKLQSKVSALARHFEQMSREFEKQRAKERRQRALRMSQARVHPTASFRPVVEVFKDADQAVNEHEPPTESPYGLSNAMRSPKSARSKPESSPQSSIPEGTPRNPMDGSAEAFKSDESVQPLSHGPSDMEDVMSDGEAASVAKEGIGLEKRVELELLSPTESHADLLEIPKHDKSSIMKMLTSFWSERSASGWTALEYPLAPGDHIFADSDVLVREDEPSSLIAFALTSQDYMDKLSRFRDRVKASTKTQAEAKGNQMSPEPDVVEQILLGDTATHMKYQFQGGPSKMQCKIFFAESFDAIRQRCGVADRFVESLSRCLKWDSKGGKTKSMFLRTLDERFVIKSLSTVETQAFLRFAPDYFDYMSKCLFHNLPSAIAKILGVYQVAIKDPVTGVDLNCFLQVMENVFYEGPSNRMFDLKGSMRNRKAHSTGQENEVLLDENLLDYLSQAPVYVRNHSHNFLASSISNDTLFCSKQNVMDYSLIVGLYDDRQELMVGIIDYIRTYTWDKKLESWIKDRGKHKPTVRSPREYRNRFRASISRYFPLAPSCWQVFGTQRTEQPSAWWDTIGQQDEPRLSQHPGMQAESKGALSPD